MTREEAARLNITESLEVRPDNDFGGMLAVMHNLHCLVSLVSLRFFFPCSAVVETYIITLPQRRVRQMMYTDYYYPEATQERLTNDKWHTRNYQPSSPQYSSY
jgi:hypothetical protein